MPSSGLRRLFNELKRRRVFNTVAIYVVGAWVALQVTELALPALDRPDRAIRWIWFAAIALFPLVMLFAWWYDLSSGGIRRTPPRSAPESPTTLQPPDRWRIGAFGLLAFGIVSLAILRVAQEVPLEQLAVQPPENSVAVMPFTACEGSSSDSGMAQQLAAEVISRLAERDRIKVTGRVSSFELRKQDLSPIQIADLLSVNYLLSGVWCRVNGSAVLDLELLDAEGRIRKRERVEQVTNAFGQVEKRIPSQVAAVVAAEFGDVLPAAIDPPVSQAALIELRRGNDWLAQGNREKSLAAYNKALELQPEFPEALYALARMQQTQGISYQQQEWVEKQKPLLERALNEARHQAQSFPNSAEAHFTAGLLLERLTRVEADLSWRDESEYDEESVKQARAEAEGYLRRAVAIDPTRVEAYIELVDIIPEDRPQERLEWFERGVSVDPFNVPLVNRWAWMLASLGRHREAFEAMDRFKAPVQTPSQVSHKLFEGLMFNGYHDEALAELLDWLGRYPPHTQSVSQLSINTAMFAVSLAFVGLEHEAADWWMRTEGTLPTKGWARDEPTRWYQQASGQCEAHDAAVRRRVADKDDAEIMKANAFLVANMAADFITLGDLVRGRGLLEHLYFARDYHPAGSTLDLFLAWLYQQDGQDQMAREVLDVAIEALERRRAAGYRNMLMDQAAAHALLGDNDTALDLLEQSIDYHFYPNPLGSHLYGWGCSPWWRPFAGLEGMPRFEALLERLEIEFDRQARVIQAMLDELDLDRVLAPIQPPVPKTVPVESSG